MRAEESDVKAKLEEALAAVRAARELGAEIGYGSNFEAGVDDAEKALVWLVEDLLS